MCVNVQDGWRHKECPCFISVATGRYDCRNPKCAFSSAHPQPTTYCTSHATCIRMMDPPGQHDIRIFEGKCSQCLQKDAQKKERQKDLAQAAANGTFYQEKPPSLFRV